MAYEREHTNMPDFDDDDSTEESGKALRGKLEKALRENGALKSKVQAFEARDFLADKGFDLVKPSDLAEIKSEDWETAASELQDQRRGEQTELLRQALAAKGFSGDDLDEMVNGFASRESSDTEAAKAFERVRQVGGVGTGRAPAVNPEDLSPEQMIAHGLSKSKN